MYIYFYNIQWYKCAYIITSATYIDLLPWLLSSNQNILKHFHNLNIMLMCTKATQCPCPSTLIVPMSGSFGSFGFPSDKRNMLIKSKSNTQTVSGRSSSPVSVSCCLETLLCCLNLNSGIRAMRKPKKIISLYTYVDLIKFLKYKCVYKHVRTYT